MKHSEYYMYSHGKCRCLDCRAVNAKVQRAYVARLQSKPIPSDRHGYASTYTNWGCRCNECADAQAKAWAKWKAKR